jgi:phosphoserine phosphatase
MYTLTLVSNPAQFPLTSAFVEAIAARIHSQRILWLSEACAVDVAGINEGTGVKEIMQEMLAGLPVDWCLQPEATRRKSLLISDMDSTIIGQECIDELADMLGVGAKVAAITERAMQGELDFSASLIARVALLEGLPVAMLERVWQERIRLNPGAETLVRTMRANGAYTMLVSGGFTFFTEKVAIAAGFEAHHANTLDIRDGYLTGKVIPPILDKDAKRHLLEQALTQHGLDASASLAVGDGANDAEMIRAAGLGVAYYAKPLLQSQADASITHTDLTTLLYFQGYGKESV